MALSLILCSLTQAQRTATAIAMVIDGGVADVTVTDPGEGYINPPSVTFTGGGGSGATATASLGSGGVGTITVTSKGTGYTSAPHVVVGPPDVLTMSVLRVRNIPEITVFGDVGSTNEIQWAHVMGDTNAWEVLTNVVLPSSPFVFYDTMSPRGDQRFYRAVVGGGGARPAAPAGFVWLPPGQFTMGSSENEQARDRDESPQTVVTLTKGFFICNHEVTQGEYLAVIGKNPSMFVTNDLNLPVENVTWIEATNYCSLLTDLEWKAGHLPTGWAYRLPTEAEWEYAARCGTTTRFSFGDDAGYQLIPGYAWYYSTSGSHTRPVSMKNANARGLYDINGNVLEWCSDWYGPYIGGSLTDPQGPTTGSLRVMRGGSWAFGPQYCRSAQRDKFNPWSRWQLVGFRTVLAIRH